MAAVGSAIIIIIDLQSPGETLPWRGGNLQCLQKKTLDEN